MARVRSFSSSSQNVKAHPTMVDCEYKTITDGSGQLLLHLSTFGSDDREAERKSSQSMQLDLEHARELARILLATFPDIAHDRRPIETNAGPTINGLAATTVVASAAGHEDDMAAVLIEAAATRIAAQLKANIQRERWTAVISRTAELLNEAVT